MRSKVDSIGLVTTLLNYGLMGQKLQVVGETAKIEYGLMSKRVLCICQIMRY